MKKSTRIVLATSLLALGAHAAQASPPAPAAPAARALDLLPPNFSSAQWQERLQGPTVEPQDVLAEAVVVPSPEGSARVHVSRAGIGSLFWAALHPMQAWRILLPEQSGDEFEADTGIRLAYLDNRSDCPGFVGTPNIRPVCH